MEPPTEEPRTLEARLDRLTSMVEKLSRANGAQTIGSDENDETEDRSQSDIRNRARNRDVSRLSVSTANKWGQRSGSIWEKDLSRPSSSERPSRPPSDEFPIPTGASTDLVDPMGSLNLGHLSLQDGGRSR